MTGYSAHWRATIFAAIIFHIVAAIGFSCLAPLMESSKKIQPVSEIEWVDVDLTDNFALTDGDLISSEAEESPSPFNAEDLVVPELNVPQFSPPVIENPKPPQKIEVKPAERPKPQQNEKPPKSDEKNSEPAKSDEKKSESKNDVMAKPPVTVTEVQPKKSDLNGVVGFVAVAVRIGKDGKVKSVEVLQSSGHEVVDEIVCKSAWQWTFQPALNQIGRPMECDKIIVFDLRAISS